MHVLSRYLSGAMIMLTGRPASASGYSLAEGLKNIFRLFELAIPDVRYEWSPDDSGFLLTLPFAVHLYDGYSDHGHAVLLTWLTEFQFTTDGDSRLFSAARAGYALGDGEIWLLTEFGGVLGQDGSGGVIGGSIAWGNSRAWMLILSYRSTWADVRRDDISLGVEISLNPI